MSTNLATDCAFGSADLALSTLARNVASRPAVSLEQMQSVASLTTRDDFKYVVPQDALSALLDLLPQQLAALEIDRRRIFDYESVYFDTENFDLYRQHAQGRRQRYKARIRSYCDSGDAMLEVKLKGRRGQTVKERLGYDFGCRAELTLEGRAFVNAVVEQAYGCQVPMLEPVLTTAYRRATLVDLEHRSRLTIDVNLRWWDRDRSHGADHVALVESKSASGPGPIDAVLCSMGMRPVRMSKYCLGVALLHPETAANPWSRLLRHQFGWQRAIEAAVPTPGR